MLRPLRRGDASAWHEVRDRNRDWLQRWDATIPPWVSGSEGAPSTYRQVVGRLRRGARAGTCLPFVLEVEGRFAGQVTVNNVVRGSAQFASLGYWLDQRVAGRGLMPRAVARVIDHCFGPVGLHRIEVCIRPENTNSLRIVEKLDLPEIGFAPLLLHIDGAWRDHRVFATTVEQWRNPYS